MHPTMTMSLASQTRQHTPVYSRTPKAMCSAHSNDGLTLVRRLSFEIYIGSRLTALCLPLPETLAEKVSLSVKLTTSRNVKIEVATLCLTLKPQLSRSMSIKLLGG